MSLSTFHAPIMSHNSPKTSAPTRMSAKRFSTNIEHDLHILSSDYNRSREVAFREMGGMTNR